MAAWTLAICLALAISSALANQFALAILSIPYILSI